MTAGRPTAGDGTRVEVVFRSERDIDGWVARHARGEVPGRWPYGLDQLASTGVPVTARSLPAPGRLAAARTRARSALPRAARPTRRRTDGGGRDIGIAWDENTAYRMLASAPHAEMHAGAIWITDPLVGGADDRRVRSTLAVLRRMDGLFVNSRAQVEPLRAAVGSSGPTVTFFHFGVDAEFFGAHPYPDRPVVVSVGGDRDRDPVTLFAALAQVAAARPDVEIVAQSTSDVPAPPGVVKVPRLSHLELRDLYRRAAVVAIATRPNLHMSGLTVSLESMATARPVVRTHTPGVDDYFRDGDNALLVPPGDPAALAARVLDLLEAPHEAEALGQRARADVERGLTSLHMVQGMARAVGILD